MSGYAGVREDEAGAGKGIEGWAWGWGSYRGPSSFNPALRESLLRPDNHSININSVKL